MSQKLPVTATPSTQAAPVSDLPRYQSPTLVQVGDLHTIQGGNGNKADSRNRLLNNLYPRD
jgi:hypothetical protein